MFNKAHVLKRHGRKNIRIFMLIQRLDDDSLYYWNSNPDDSDWPLGTDEIVSSDTQKQQAALSQLVKVQNAKIMHPENTKPQRRYEPV